MFKKMKCLKIFQPVLSLIALIPPPFNFIVGGVLIVLTVLGLFLMRKWIKIALLVVLLIFAIRLIRKFLKKRKSKTISANDDITVTTQTTIRKMDIDNAYRK